VLLPEALLIIAYVSGHGFGHATRSGEVLRAVRAAAPDLPLAIVSTAPEWLFQRALPGAFEYRPRAVDVGVVQSDALTMDEGATAERWREFVAGRADRVREEAAWLRSVGARVVFGDIPPLAFEAAAAAGIPSVALANFAWDWIYRHLARRAPALAEAAEQAARGYAECGLLLELPFAGGLHTFPRREAIPLVARRGTVARDEARARLGLEAGRRAVLLSFGGLGLPGFHPAALGGLTEYAFLGGNGELAAPILDGLGLRYEDVVGAVDVVVSKPGYGIVTDAIAARTPLVYTERGDFPEYAVLVEQMPRFLPVAFVSNADLRSGRLGPALREALAKPFPPPPDLNGAEVAARRLLERL
jgi:hypothetical protein